MVWSRKTKKGTVYYVTARKIPEGTWTSIRSGPDKKLAEMHEKRLQVEWQRWIATGVYDRKRESQAVLLNRWEEELEKLASAAHARLSRVRAERVLERLPKTPLEHLVVGDLRKVIDGLTHLSRKTRREYARSAIQYTEWLVGNAQLQRNPFAGYRAAPDANETRNCRRALTLDEVRRLAEHAKGGRAVLYYLAATTGLRAGEIRNLRWRDILDEPVPHICLPGWRDGKRMTKNGEEALIPLQPWVRDMLPSPGHPDHLLFANITKRTAEMIRNDAVPCGIDTQGLVFHSLRASTFGILKELEVDDTIIKKIMRHASYETTLSHYDRRGLLEMSLAAEIPDPRRGL